MVRSPVFIIGSPRSGTSILGNVLKSVGFDGFSEGHLLSLLAPINTLIENHFTRFAKFQNRPVLIAHVDKDALKKNLFAVFGEAQAALNPRSPWFDKTGPELIPAVPILLQLWPSSIFVFTKRRAIENINSRVKKFPHISFEQHCISWAKLMGSWRTMRGGLPAEKYVELDQFDMINSPGTIAKELQKVLDLDAAQTARAEETFVSRRPQETSEGSSSKYYSLESVGWSDSEKSTFLKHCHAQMEAYGYTTDESYRRKP